MVTFKDNLKALRIEAGIGQVELAKQIGVSKGIISLWENGLREPNMYSLISNIGECICLLICTVLISIIYYNVRHKRIFIHTNANLIKGIGTVVMFGNLITDFIIIKILPEYARYTSMNHFSIVMGLFIIAIGYVFQEAIKMKEEQDLTI